jgi:hypothetical protein
MIGKYFQAVAALNAANKIARGDGEVVERADVLRKKISQVEMQSELKGVMVEALKKLETMQNGI